MRSKLDEVDQETVDEIMKFVDDMEGHFNDIENLLGDITLDNLSNVEEAHGIAKEEGVELY